MYGYKEYTPLTTDEILKRVTEEEIFSIVIKEEIQLEKDSYYVAPYRNDNLPGCYFHRYNEILYFVDFADSENRQKNCFSFISRCFNLDYNDTLEYVNNYFKLGLGSSENNVKSTLNIVKTIQKSELKPKINKFIQYLARPFNIKDKLFWSKYEISREQLIEDKVVPISLYRTVSNKGKIFSINPPDIMYAYTDFPDNKVKIYRPKGNKKEKWITNCNQNDVGSINNLPETGELLIISKSYKDCRVLRNQKLNCVWFQNEGMLPSQDILTMLCERFKQIIVWFDNDQAGITNGRIVTNYINSIVPNKARLIFLPPILLQEKIKDPSDLISKKGKDELLLFLKEKKIYV